MQSSFCWPREHCLFWELMFRYSFTGFSKSFHCLCIVGNCSGTSFRLRSTTSKAFNNKLKNTHLIQNTSFCVAPHSSLDEFTVIKRCTSIKGFQQNVCKSNKRNPNSCQEKYLRPVECWGWWWNLWCPVTSIHKRKSSKLSLQCSQKSR